MKNFTVQVEYDGHNYECYVQKLKDKEDNVYIVNFFANTLIKQYQSKRIVLCAQRLNLGNAVEHPVAAANNLPAFEANLWRAIWLNDK
ncbi:hypothetical protein [Deminuibacter soli]|uniref:Uncharacterized protein n=1 Tax=Deminuibacter soli TaxID=2291815 RepID=A0A3E1NEP8_9BACT|nr:hypothetical protein [Deminuibacter soli]RFM26332.1 hypothetical protein DXN05_20705 [Deminuibacter soli]